MSSLRSSFLVGSSSTPRAAVTAYLGVGSNVGDRPSHIASAVRLLRRLPSTRITRTSHLYESSPVGLSQQPMFLNAAIELHTGLAPHALLAELKHIERALGRDMSAVRFGPRVIDLDVLMYGQQHISTDTLVVPHPRMRERRFVLEPLADLISDALPDHPREQPPSVSHAPAPADSAPLTPAAIRSHLASMSASPSTASDVVYRVLPLSSSVFRHVGRSVVMGIVNVTPDSFSDGGSQHTHSPSAALEYALQLRREGADVLDVGGESTRPGAVEVSVEEEQRRVLPLIAQLHAAEPQLPISVDTRHSDTARKAVAAGACMVNDVSGGVFDPSMLPAVAELGVAYCCMHARGLPESMTALARYDNVVDEVRGELKDRLAAAEAAGIAKWNIVQDPGLGFAKTQHHNVRPHSEPTTDSNAHRHMIRNTLPVRASFSCWPVLRVVALKSDCAACPCVSVLLSVRGPVVSSVELVGCVSSCVLPRAGWCIAESFHRSCALVVLVALHSLRAVLCCSAVRQCGVCGAGCRVWRIVAASARCEGDCCSSAPRGRHQAGTGKYIDTRIVTVVEQA